MSLRGRRLVVVTGKGGVGRTTLTLALGRAAAAEGLRTVVVELSGQDALARTAGFAHRSYTCRQVAPGLDVRSLSAPECVADFATRKLHVPALLAWIFESRILTGFIEAVPGLHDLVQLGKVENMLREPLAGEPAWDVAILDAPATGHGLTLLAGARAMRDMTGVGPFYELAAIIEELLADPALTQVIVVTLPEALPVHESLELCRALEREHTPPHAVLVNLVRPSWPDSPPPPVVLGAIGTEGAGAELRALAETAIARSARQEEVLAELHAGLPANTRAVRLPRLDDPGDLDPIVAPLRPLFRSAP